MTKQEQSRYAANFMKRRTSRIVGLQNGFNDVMSAMQFDADPYNSGTIEETNDSSIGAPDTTTRTDSVGDSDWQGTVPGGSNDDSEIYGALDILQKHVASLGSSDLLDLWASTADALRKTVSSAMAKGSPNEDGQTREPLVVNDNDSSSYAGSHGFIPTSELQKMQSEAAQLTNMTSRVVLNPGDRL